MSGKHTATPWEVCQPNYGETEGCGPETYKYSVRGPGTHPVVSFQICELSSINGNEDADAAFIVRACNAHDDLVRALKGLIRAGHGLTPSSHEWNAAHEALAKAEA